MVSGGKRLLNHALGVQQVDTSHRAGETQHKTCDKGGKIDVRTTHCLVVTRQHLNFVPFSFC